MSSISLASTPVSSYKPLNNVAESPQQSFEEKPIENLKGTPRETQGETQSTLSAFSLSKMPSISPKQAYDTLKAMRVMETITGKSSDPRIKFNLVQNAAPNYFNDVAGALMDLSNNPQHNTYQSQRDAREVFEKIEVFTWALQTSTSGLAGTSNQAGNRPLPDNPDFIVELITDITEAEKLFDTAKNEYKFSAGGKETLVPTNKDSSDQTIENPFKTGPRFNGLLNELGKEFSIHIFRDVSEEAVVLNDMSNRNDNFSLIGQAAAIFTFAQALLEQNSNLLGEGTENEAQDILIKIFENIRTSAKSLVAVEQKYGGTPPPPLDIKA